MHARPSPLLRTLSAAAAVAAACVAASGTRAGAIEVPNADFAAGDQSPEGWTLHGGQGRWVDKNILEVIGEGRGSAEWRCDGVKFESGKLYRFEFRARGSISGGCVISGPSFANRDWHELSPEWKWYGFVFRAPDNCEGGYLRLGHWEAKGAVQFDAVRIRPVLPVQTQVGDLVLGEGESIRDGRYLFQGTFGHEGSNFHRVLDSATAGFNSDRWCFGRDSQVTYRFALPGRKLSSASVAVDVSYHTGGACVAEASADGQKWRTLATQDKLGSAETAVPADMLPAAALWLRLRGAGARCNFQVNRVEFEGKLDAAMTDASGDTAFAALVAASPELAFRQIILREGMGRGYTSIRGGKRLAVTVGNTGKEPLKLRLSHEGDASAWTSASGSGPMAEGWIAPGEAASSDFALPGDSPGAHTVTIEVTGQKESGQAASMKAKLDYSIPDFYRADYGELLGAGNSPVALWWCDATHKVPRQRSAPKNYAPAARMSAARNDREAVQIVVRPQEPLRGLTAAASPLAGPDGATIPAENIKLLRVYYHYVHTPTDKTGVRDWWPDALPPLDSPIDVPAGQNQPLWVLVHVPKDAKPGDYSGTVKLKAEGFEANVPVKLHVWDFTLPDRNRLETAYGLSPGTIFQYHGLKTEEDKRKVLDMYFRCFSEHRISPYDPTPLDPIRVKWLPEADPPRAEVDFSAFDPAMERTVREYHFNTFRLHVQGMGGGTFHERYEPAIGRFGENTPQYQAMFSSYVKQLEDHLRAKGWLDMAYVYWFDEPDPKDYEFVTAGVERLKKYAPGLRRMMTEEPSDEFKAPIDIWCPVSFNFSAQEAEKARAKGAVFWWYVCCGPKAPYCTLFIDHPATELRIWHWQTWQRDIVGTLVWSSNYWTSDAAYPDKPQDPYEDPMGYVSGYSTPKGVKRYWGNGDGRFIYPPLAASVPGKSPGPVIAPPVSSIRWEMIREGVEDFECLYLLRELVEKHRGKLAADKLKHYESLLAVPEAITKDMTTFTTDPGPIYARRAQIAAAIQELSK